MAPGESKDERDKRVAKLWETLDTRKEGHIDLNGLKKGLKKIDHRESGAFRALKIGLTISSQL
jgi:hypothetical protein